MDQGGGEAGWLSGSVCVYVSCLGSRLGAPAKLPDVDKKHILVQKWRHFYGPLRLLESGILEI
jgi:hypothetical protein